MKNIIAITLLLLFMSSNINAQNDKNDDNKTDTLIGKWTIDLRPTAESEGYFQSFVIESIEGNTFKGTFYGSQLEKSLLNDNWEKLYFAFTTKDQSNDYYHSGYLLNGKLFGITYCPNREFTAPWIGEKE